MGGLAAAFFTPLKAARNGGQPKRACDKIHVIALQAQVVCKPRIIIDTNLKNRCGKVYSALGQKNSRRDKR
jgi:hypothetical protein